MSDNIKRIVVKVGTNVLTNKDNRILGPVLKELVRQIAVLYERDIMVILVSSGSAIAGIEILGNTHIKDKSIRRQVYSSVGQPRIMRRYYTLFQDYGMRCGQVLATKRDFDPGKYRENMINCYEGLLSEGVIPIANEDDTVSLTTSMFSDNDELASLIAELVNADRFIILSDTDGLYNGHPDNEDSEKLNVVTINQKVEHYVQSSYKKEGEGRGGMASKLRIAKGTAKKNIPTYIANGKKHNVIVDIIDNKPIGTKFINA
ncbi:glutamate 5-kinase [Paucihalobacter ruber]|uniref:Glutamate 5-kinase n=1 Tax=Paucihalobacter ruber TaxID=2567861 RepID=A0A506PR99_9FLAO|nr:glutamate 5-kinase [Paucihalobacter ruber]TPV35725.1 glutamate 5-kinase [Paucihalobacter ruber]